MAYYNPVRPVWARVMWERHICYGTNFPSPVGVAVIGQCHASDICRLHNLMGSFYVHLTCCCHDVHIHWVLCMRDVRRVSFRANFRLFNCATCNDVLPCRTLVSDCTFRVAEVYKTWKRYGCRHLGHVACLYALRDFIAKNREHALVLSASLRVSMALQFPLRLGRPTLALYVAVHNRGMQPFYREKCVPTATYSWFSSFGAVLTVILCLVP